MKIYEIGTGYTPIPAKISAATEIVVEELTKAFLKQNIPVEIIDIASDNRADNQLPIHEVKVPRTFSGTDVQLGIMHKLKRVVYSLALAGELKKILRKTDESVVFHFHNQYNLFFFLKLVPSALRSRCKIAYTNHSGIWRLEWKEIRGIIKKRYFQEAECMKQADLLFVLNEETKKNVVMNLGIKESRIICIDNGVNTDIYAPLSEQHKLKMKEKWGLVNKRVILQVGSVYENKGQLRSVRYLIPLLKKHPDLIFVYAGGIVEEDYQAKIWSCVRENALDNRVRYLGMLHPGRELNELYNIAEVSILPSKYESFGLVAIESLAAGVPVLLDCTGPIYFGEGSIIYNCDSFVNTVEAVLYKDSGDYSQLCAAARENARHNYSWDKVAQDYLSAFQR